MDREEFIRLSLITAAGSAVGPLAIGGPRGSGLPGADWHRPPVDPPSALVAEAGDRRVDLEWNPNLEADLAGYRVYRQHEDNNVEPVHQKLLSRPQFTAKGVANGQPATYRVKAVLADGTTSEASNPARARPHATAAPQVTEGACEVQVPGFDPIHLDEAVKVTFENGHQLIFDTQRARVRDWQTAGGAHLWYPRCYGNPIDLAKFNAMGFSEPRPATGERPVLPPTINLDYNDQQRKRHPRYIGHELDDNKIRFHYRIPLSGPGEPAGSDRGLWVWADLWETWGPVKRDIKGTAYSGLARKIELKLSGYYDEGYAVCLNEGLGLSGSCQGALTYQLFWRKPSLGRMRWQKTKDQQQAMGTPRGSQGFHPTKWALQVNPFLFARFGVGTMLVAPRRYHHAITYCLTNYVARGHDGLWSNLKIDCATSGRRHAIETFEYLWTPDTSLAAPQQFMDASFHYRRRLARLYGLNPHLTSFDNAWNYWGPSQSPIDDISIKDKPMKEKLQILKKWGKVEAQKADQIHADLFGGAHELWTSSPATVPDKIRLDPNHPINRAIKQMISAFRNRGIGFIYWMRPEFVKTALPNVLSKGFSNKYYGYTNQHYPPAMPLLQRRGLKLIREHPEWIRVGRGGGHPQDTPYHWTPMSLTRPDGWYEHLVYKDLVMMKKLGYTAVLQDGGFSCLTGVDYTGGPARAVQPYYWRYYRDINRLGMVVDGECMRGWGNSNLNGPTKKEKDLWPYVHCTLHKRSARDKWWTPALRHQAHQLYVASYISLDTSSGHAKAAKFAQDFLAEHGHPDRIFLEGLRETGQEEGSPWTWDSVWWEYSDGRRVRYPDWEEI